MLAVSSPSVSFLLRSTQRPGPPPAASGPPQPPRFPPRGPGLGQRDIFFFSSLEHPYFGKAGPVQRCRAGARSLSPSAAFYFYHEVRPAAASPPLSSGVGEDECGSRQEPSFIRNRHLAPAPPAAAGPGSGSG